MAGVAFKAALFAICYIGSVRNEMMSEYSTLGVLHIFFSNPRTIVDRNYLKVTKDFHKSFQSIAPQRHLRPVATKTRWFKWRQLCTGAWNWGDVYQKTSAFLAARMTHCRKSTRNVQDDLTAKLSYLIRISGKTFPEPVWAHFRDMLKLLTSVSMVGMTTALNFDMTIVIFKQLVC